MAKWAGRVGWIQRPEVRIPGHDFFDVELQVGDSEYVEYGVCVSFGMRRTMSKYNACAGVSTLIIINNCVACALSQSFILISALTPAQTLHTDSDFKYPGLLELYVGRRNRADRAPNL